MMTRIIMSIAIGVTTYLVVTYFPGDDAFQKARDVDPFLAIRIGFIAAWVRLFS